jgi:hypothetical protein
MKSAPWITLKMLVKRNDNTEDTKIKVRIKVNLPFVPKQFAMEAYRERVGMHSAPQPCTDLNCNLDEHPAALPLRKGTQILISPKGGRARELAYMW